MTAAVLRTTNTIIIVKTNLKNATTAIFERAKRETYTQEKHVNLLVIDIFPKNPLLKNLRNVTPTMPLRYQIYNFLRNGFKKKSSWFEK